MSLFYLCDIPTYILMSLSYIALLDYEHIWVSCDLNYLAAPIKRND